MAEAAVVLALGKLVTSFGVSSLRTYLEKEPARLPDLPYTAKRIERELDMIHHFLSQVGTKIYSNKVLEGWIVRVRKVAYRVEDITDEYSYNIALEHENHFKRLIHKFFYPTAFHRIAIELKDIEEEIKHLSQLKRDYREMFNELLDNTSDSAHIHLLSSNGSPHAVKGDDIVGMKEDMELLGRWLDPKELDRTVISIWGFGGLGKTTLVRKVYDWEKGMKSFDCYSWIAVSHNYNINAILRQLIQELSEDQSKIPTDLDTMHHGKLNDELKEVLSNKKYLIVLDDVWDTRAFHELSDSLMDDKKGSRIIITTRNNDVASLAQEMYKMKLNPLGNDDAFELFRRRCFQKSNMECPSHLEELSRQIVNKCGGLPLAINAIGNVLAVQESKEIVWRRINNQFKCELEDNPGLDKVRSALSISFMYLPRHLKNCFLYCSMFPQDYIFKRELLIKLWIVEGFVIQRGQSTLEEVADGYFTELIQQSMMQLVENDEIGRVVSCRMHDIMRELALSFSRKERFGLADINLETQKKDDVRRLLVSNFDQVNQLIKSSMDLPRLRTFIAANRVANYQLLTLLISRCKYLAVLELRDSPLDKIPENIGDLFNLRYLGLRRTRIKSLPISIKKLTNLETLDLKSTNIERLPREVAKLKKLRHIFAEQLYDPEERQLRYFRGVKLPDGAFDLAQLQTLQTVEATKKSVKLLKYLPELRLLCVENVCRADCATLFSSLSNMNHLYDLVISANDLNEPLDFNAFNPICTKLEKLTIRGCWDNETFRRPVFCEYGANIKYLTLTFCKNDTNPLPSISSSVPNLIFLSIRRGCWAEDIILRAGWFPQLRTLWLGKLEELRRLVIEEGAIIRLEVLLLLSLPSLREVPKGLELLASLKKLNVTMQHHELKVEWERDNWKTKLHRVQEIRF
ncbi:disease resistance protein RPM1-like [Oryza glaberrima]|uniref:NB-ARC domain-containing protein n=2 Tax=Oryza TaxID=4527 RepID=A0A0D3F1V1_9ORYZ|nr:disease resistance protein RPM1-like [Oryza glaberrima]